MPVSHALSIESTCSHVLMLVLHALSAQLTCFDARITCLGNYLIIILRLADQHARVSVRSSTIRNNTNT